MDPIIKGLWSAELRSGRYRKIHSYLSDSSNGRCCLGVLCELAVEAGIVRRDTENVERYRRPVYVAVDDDNDVGIGLLPVAVANWAGLTSRDPAIIQLGVGGGYRTATELNDDENMSFGEIADKIDEGDPR